MTRIFAKRFWGFDPVLWPVVSFALDGNRDALLRASRAGDLVLFIGTQTEETGEADRGRLLGLAEFARNEVETADLVDVARLASNAFDENGRIRWPKAVPMLRAWRLVDRPRVTDVLKAQLTFPATVRAILLDEDDASAVLALRREEVQLPDSWLIGRFRSINDALRMTAPTTGPKPTSWISVVSRDAEIASYTYALRFGVRDVWKIGHATDLKARLAEVNRHVPEEILGEGWRLALQQLWPNASAAYAMEQRVLAALRTPPSVGERVLCTSDRSKRHGAGAWSREPGTVRGKPARR